MFRNRYLNFGYLSVFSVIFGIVVSLSVVKAATFSHSNAPSAQPYVEENISNSKPYELAYGEAENVEEVELNVKGMTCGMCENAVKAALLKCNGVKDAEVSHKEGKAVVKVEEGKAKTDELIKAVEKAGFSASKS
ncbi:MAG: heavy-metal-associated domain-containing protein [Candidatus Scalinduaceae bacterium]